MPVFSVTALLFDCDGVLVDSHDAAAVAWNEWGTRWKPGFDFHRDVEHGRRLADFVTELVGPEDAPEAIAELAALERDHAVDVREIRGAAALLANLPAGSWAVVTSGTRDIATARLTAAGLPTPAVLVAADDVAKGKPSADPYLLAAQRINLPPHDCAVFEDAAAGVTAAQRAGVRTIIGVGIEVAIPGISAAVPDLRGITFDGARLFVAESDTSPQART
jgi:mannitol-1-/sugar-/sorbitol-6-phosphatase